MREIFFEIPPKYRDFIGLFKIPFITDEQQNRGKLGPVLGLSFLLPTLLNISLSVFASLFNFIYQETLVSLTIKQCTGKTKNAVLHCITLHRHRSILSPRYFIYRWMEPQSCSIVQNLVVNYHLVVS